MKSKDQQLLEEAYQKILKEGQPDDPRQNAADYSNRPVSDYSEPKDFPKKRDSVDGPVQKPNLDSLSYAFKNDVIVKPKLGSVTVYWVYSAPKVGEYGGERKHKNITELVNVDSSSPNPYEALVGQEFDGKFGRFKIVSITPEEHRERNKMIPSGVMTASVKAVPIK
jgi:hypothetical protein